MAENLLNELGNQVGEVLKTKGSDLLNEKKEDIEKGLNALLPALFGAIVQRGSSEKGAGELMEIIKTENYNGGLLESIGGMLDEGGNSLDPLLEKGNKLVDNLLGEKEGGLTEMIANYANLDRDSSSSLLHIVTPLIMSLIGRKVEREGLNAGGLMNLLSRQKTAIQEAMPPQLAGISKLLGFHGDLFELGEPKPGRKGGMGWIIWVIAVLVIAAIVYFFFLRGEGPSIPEEPMPDTTGQTAPATETEPAADTTIPQVDTAASIGEQFNRFLEGGEPVQGQTFTFAAADFPSGSAQLTEALRRETRRLAEILEANPNLNVTLTAYSTGDADLAQQRAMAVKSRLQDQGIPAARIQTSGEVIEAGEKERITVTVR